MSETEKSSTWADAKKGDDVVINGKTFRVRKVKIKGKAVKVTIERSGREFTSEVKAKAKVQIVTTPLHDAKGGQNRWATKSELKAAGLAPGNPDLVKPPEKATGSPWETPADRVEKKLDQLLGARLVAEGNEKDGYYVPPVDASTIASHMALMHPNTYDPAKDEATMLAGHEHEHKMVLAGKARLGVVHWHTKNRP